MGNGNPKGGGGVSKLKVHPEESHHAWIVLHACSEQGVFWEWDGLSKLFGLRERYVLADTD